VGDLPQGRADAVQSGDAGEMLEVVVGEFPGLGGEPVEQLAQRLAQRQAQNGGYAGRKRASGSAPWTAL
jgi:hypothetical protein